jgi:hypothetical protein
MLVAVVFGLTNSVGELFSTRVNWFVVWANVGSAELFVEVAPEKASTPDEIAFVELGCFSRPV